MSDERKEPESVEASDCALLLAALEEMVKSERRWEDLILCYDEEDGFWVATVERGESRPFPVHDVDLGARRATLREAIEAAVEWHNSESQKRFSGRKPIHR